MRRNIVLLLCFMLYSFSALAAEEDQKEVLRLTTLPTQYLFYDFPFIVEKRFHAMALGATFAYRFSTEDGGQVNGISGLLGDYINQNFWNPMYSAVTLGMHAKYFLGQQKTWFLEPGVFYRYWWFDNKEVQYDNVEGYRFDGTRSETQQVYAFRLLVGSDIAIRSSSKVKAVMEWYCGLGFRYKTYLFKTYDGTVNDQYYTYKEDVGSVWKPSIHLGIRLGVGYFTPY